MPLKDDTYLRKGGELSLSSESLTEILHAVLSRGATFRFKAKGFSMYPFVNDGDIVTVSKLRSEPGLGDVVAFTHLDTGRLAVHRIVGKKGSSYFIKGDNVLEMDGLIPGENVLGIITNVKRLGRDVPLGLGPEKLIVAFLSRGGFLFAVVGIYRLICQLIRRDAL